MKAGYKQTDVGVIPEDWNVKPLEAVFALKHGFAFGSEYFSNAGPIILTPGNFRLEGGLYFEERNTKHYSGSYSQKMIFRRGDLLIVMTDLTPDCNLLGKPAFVERDEVILHNQRIGKVVFKDQSVEPQLLFYFLLSQQYLGQVKEHATGSTVRHTSNKSIYSVQLAFPPLYEQRAIATALRDVDALLSTLDRLIAKKWDLKQAAMQQLLTGNQRLPGFAPANPRFQQTDLGLIPDDWTQTTIGALEPFVTSGSRGWARYYADRGDLFVRITNMSRDSIHLDLSDSQFVRLPSKGHEGARTQLNFGDLLISVTADIGIVSYVDDGIQLPAYINQHIALVRFDSSKANRLFVSYLLAHERAQKRFRAVTDQGAKAGINLTSVRDIRLVLPPEIAEQTAIAEVLQDMDAELRALEQRRDKTRALKQGMMQELLTGRTRLVPDSVTEGHTEGKVQIS